MAEVNKSDRSPLDETRRSDLPASDATATESGMQPKRLLRTSRHI
jgi:hypothetical protein